MAGKSRRFALLTILAAIATGAAAQKNEIVGGVGRSLIPDQSIRTGPIPLTNNVVSFRSGTLWELDYARHLARRGSVALDAEMPLVRNPDQELQSGNGAVPKAYSSLFLTPAARVRFFAENALQLWVSGGGGLGHWTISNTLVSGGINPGPKTKNGAVAQGAAGLDLRPWKRFGFRAGVRDFYSGELPLNVNTGKSHQHNLLVTGGLIFIF
ncbi:MAG: hypothetical protein JO249_25855 [Acidobacteria bacterium]|nr:hypothetical protein [Acidobacteriota bacterium]